MLADKQQLLGGLREVHAWKAKQAALTRCCAWEVVYSAEEAVEVSQAACADYAWMQLAWSSLFKAHSIGPRQPGCSCGTVGWQVAERSTPAVCRN